MNIIHTLPKVTPASFLIFSLEEIETLKNDPRYNIYTSTWNNELVGHEFVFPEGKVQGPQYALLLDSQALVALKHSPVYSLSDVLNYNYVYQNETHLDNTGTTPVELPL